MPTRNIALGLVLAGGAILTPTLGQQYVISTYAGGGLPPAPTAGMNVSIGAPSGVAMDASGSIYFASLDQNAVFKLDPNGVLTPVAGNSRLGYSGDGGPAANAQLNRPTGVAVDSAGNLFIADAGNNRIRRVSPDGIIATVAGNGTAPFSGEGGPATSAQLGAPAGVAVDAAGNLFIADYDGARKVSASGIITTVAGNNGCIITPLAPISPCSPRLYASGVAVDGAGNLFIADSGSNRVHQVSPDGVVTTVAGSGFGQMYSGEGGPATSAVLAVPSGVAVDSVGNLFIADSAGVHKVSASGIITTVAGNSGCINFPLVPNSPCGASLRASGVAVGGAGNLFIADAGYQRIRKVSPDGIIITLAGNGSTCCFSGDGEPATSAQLHDPRDVAVDGAGNLFIVDAGNQRVRKVSPDGIMTTVAGNGNTWGSSGDGGPATSAPLNFPLGVAVDGAGNLFIADFNNNSVRKVSPSGIINTVAGNGRPGYGGDGGPATSAQLNGPRGMALDGAGNLLIVDIGNNCIRKVSPSGIITTVSGNGTGGFSGDGGPATSAQLSFPRRVALDGAGNLFIVDGGNKRIRMVSSSGIITTVAGGGFDFPGDGGPAAEAQLIDPAGVAADAAGNLFIADYGSHRIRKVSPSGIITTVAGNGSPGFSGDGGPATTAALNGPTGLAVTGEGNVYVVDTGNNVVRILRPTSRSVLLRRWWMPRTEAPIRFLRARSLSSTAPDSAGPD